MPLYVCGPLALRTNGPYEIGDGPPGHKHDFDHPTIIIKGSFRLEATLPDGTKIDRVMHHADFANIVAGVEHKLTALTKGAILYCAYPHRNEDGEVVLEYHQSHPAAYH